jgi:5'-nucleotidase
MRILLTNDDGVLSPVLYRVADALAAEHEIAVAAPATDQSGKSHGFTHGPEKLLTYRQDGTVPYPLFAVDGTPSDCIKFAVTHLFRERRPELVVSGINLGENAGISAVYSGTVAAAREAAMWEIPALAVSLMGETEAHIEFALVWLQKLLRRPEALPAPRTLWNVNFPACAPEAVEGTEFTAMSTVMFQDGYEESRTAHGIAGYRLQGRKAEDRFIPGTDDHALRRRRVAITPLQLAQTDVGELEALKARGDWLKALSPPAAARGKNAAPA